MRVFLGSAHAAAPPTSEKKLLALIADLNADQSIHCILVQLPLPGHLDAEPVIQSIRPEKDVDGLHVVNAGKLATGDLTTGLISCTPAGAMLLVEPVHGRDLSGLATTVVGRSNLFGKPMAQLLLNANATVTIAHSRTRDLAGLCRNADILVIAVGRPKMVKAEWIKPGATVIDVGINRVPAPDRESGKGRLVGDVDFAKCSDIAGAISPVPGGVGPMTIAMLMANTLIATYQASGLKRPAVRVA
jgi:methylenetetrahydrofolate dehydrogenase (NADP+) / methenyltetrahydrofolate cyclohydrolase